MVILAFGTSGSRGVRTVACPAWCARGGHIKLRALSALPTFRSAPSSMAHGTCGMGRGTILCGTDRGGIGAQIAQQGSQETQRGPLPHKTLGTEKHLHCIPFCAVTWS